MEESFIFQVKTEIRENMTNLEDVMGLMFLSKEAQQVADMAARIAVRMIRERDKEIARLEEMLEEQQSQVAVLERDLDHEQMATFMQPTFSAKTADIIIQQLKEKEELKELLERKNVELDARLYKILDQNKEIEDLKSQLDQERSRTLSVLEKMKTE